MLSGSGSRGYTGCPFAGRYDRYEPDPYHSRRDDRHYAYEHSAPPRAPPLRRASYYEPEEVCPIQLPFSAHPPAHLFPRHFSHLCYSFYSFPLSCLIPGFVPLTVPVPVPVPTPSAVPLMTQSFPSDRWKGRALIDSQATNAGTHTTPHHLISIPIAIPTPCASWWSCPMVLPWLIGTQSLSSAM